MKLKTLSKSLALLLTLCLFLSLGASAFAMDFGAFAAAGIDPSFAAQSYTQQVELTLNMAALQAESAQNTATLHAAAAQTSAELQVSAAQNTPVVSEGGNLNGGTGDVNTIIVQGSDGTPIVGASDVGQNERLDKNKVGITISSNLGLITQNDGTVKFNGWSSENLKVYITINNGTVGTNYPSATVENNNGTVEENYGTVLNNNSGGTVTYNCEGGTVETNRGTVTYNWGTLQTNEQGGTVTYNSGTVTLNNGTVKALLAGTVETNNGTINLIEQKGVVQTNGEDGTIITNKGTVWYNEGEIEKNNLDVWGNAGIITVNNGSVTDNLNLVKENKGSIDANVENAVVEKNIGNINKNYGTVDNYADGIVQMNYGTVFLYGGEVTESGDGGIELFQVTIERSANTSVTDAADGLTAHNGEAWKEAGNISGETATVTISPAAGYSITNIAATDGITPVQNADGSWTVTVDADLVNAGSFTLDTSVQQDAPPSSYPPIGSGDGSDPYDYGGYHTDPVYDESAYFADILSLLNITMEPAPAAGYAGPNAYDAFNDERIAELSSAAENGTVTIDLRSTGWTTLKREVFEAAARRGDVTIVILYRQWGRDYTLTIPAGTDFSALSGAQFLEVTQLPGLLGLSAV
ncbi:MAG: hypothetical protein IJG40_16600 [Oscillospiraceae bacterium]|nr:hypothetical protein [Oscillospiraceae bacterium]